MRWGPLLSGVLTAIACTGLNTVLVWLCFVPLFWSLDLLSLRSCFKAGLFFGAALGIGLFYWMIPGARRFTDSSPVYGLLAFFLSVGLLSLFFGILTLGFGLVKWNGKGQPINKKGKLINALMISSLFCLGEALMAAGTKGLPWYGFHAGLPLATNLYTIQAASFFGVYILSFVVLLVNYLIAVFIRQKSWIKLWIPAAVVGIYFLTGFFILKQFNAHLKPAKKIRVAIVTENIPPEIKWDDQTGDALAARLISLSREAARAKPDIALWSESAIPWTYRKDDDLVAAIVNASAPAAVTQILGINTETHQPNEVFNSAYCIPPDGKPSGRYDKQVLLRLIEKPLMGLVMPFRSSAGFTAQTGIFSAPLVTPFGNAGILICNESTVPAVAYNAVNKGADFLCNISNDGWFRESYLADLHFYHARLRAVETRKDLVVNSNMGYAGLIQASGQKNMLPQSTQPRVHLCTVNANGQIPLSTRRPGLFCYLCAGILIMGLICRLFFGKEIVN